MPLEKGPVLQIGLPWGVPPEGQGYYTILPNKLDMTPDILELVALIRLQEKPLPARVLSRTQERISLRRPWFAGLVRTAFSESRIVDSDGVVARPTLPSTQSGLNGWLNAVGEWLLRHSYPMFERFAPGHGPLSKEAYREFMKYACENDLTLENAPESVKLIREAYLVPMDLMQRRKTEYTLNTRLESHDLVKLLNPLLDNQPAPARVYEHLSAPPFGLLPDQIHLLLITLLVLGEIDIIKGNHSYRESYETLPTPIYYDRILPGRALNLNQIRDLQTLCEGFRIPVPRQWTVLAQKRAIDQLRKYGSRQRQELDAFISMLRSHGEADDLLAQVEKALNRWLALEKGDHELQGFQHFLYEIGSPHRFLAEAMEMASLPNRFEKLLVESRKFKHLFGYTCVKECGNPNISVGLEALGLPPPISNTEALQAWTNQASFLYQNYMEWYRQAHQQWWQSIHNHQIWSYRSPVVARSRHVAAADLVRQLETLQAKAKTSRCSGLTDLSFQPVCFCGFDGKESPLTPLIRDFEKTLKILETDLALFFQQDKVKNRVAEWVDQKLEDNSRTLSYLEGKADFPEIVNVALFDQHLSGIELAKTLESGSFLDFIGDTVWEKAGLLRAFEQFLNRTGASRIRFRRLEQAPRQDLLKWCCEQALRHGVPLPALFTPDEYALLPSILRPDWITESSICNLERMGLGEAAICSIIEMLLNGVIIMPREIPASGPVAAAQLLLSSQPVATVAELAQQIQLLYLENDRFRKLRSAQWLSLLQNLAESTVDALPLETKLQNQLDSQWIVVDCLGLPLTGMMRDLLDESFSHWKSQSLDFCMVRKSSTDDFYQSLLDGDLKKSFRKINSVDELIHHRDLNFAGLLKLARAELEIAFKRIASELDKSRDIVIFGDHGFRLDSDGNRFSHGGSSTLERLTPVFVLVPFTK